MRWFRLITVPLVAALAALSLGTNIARADEPVPDANFRACINAKLGQAPDAAITVAQLNGLADTLKCDGKGIADATGTQHLTNLKVLDLSDNELVTPPTLAGLTNLQMLGRFGNQMTTPPVLTGLTNLELLLLDNNQLTTPPNLTGLTNLKGLYLDSNQLTTSPTLTGLANLQQLDLLTNRITDFSSVPATIDDFSGESQKLEVDAVMGSPLPLTIKNRDGKTLTVTPGADVAYAAGVFTFTATGDLTTTFTGKDISGTITFHVSPAPAAPAITPLSDQNVVEGDTATFTTTISGGIPQPVTITWSTKAPWDPGYTPILGATNASYTTGAAALAEHGTMYQVTACNTPKAGDEPLCVTSEATLNVYPTPPAPPEPPATTPETTPSDTKLTQTGSDANQLAALGTLSLLIAGA